MSPARESEYAELHAFIDFVSTHVSRIDPDNPIHPTNVGKRIVAEYGKSKALEGLKQAINDTVEDLGDKPIEFLNALDTALRERQIITFSEVRRRYAASYRRIIKRGQIKTETEYYIVRGILSDFTALTGEDERNALEAMLTSYESEA
jgi:methionine synthase II (cobalamin-independent)